jgi:hypothetical protein
VNCSFSSARPLTPGHCTLGMADDILSDMSKPERKSLLDGLRRRLGLPSIADYEALENRRRAEMRIPSQRPPRLVFTESGAIVDLNETEAEANRERVRAESLAVQRAAEHAQRAVEAQGIREREQAAAEQHRRELPPGIPG